MFMSWSRMRSAVRLPLGILSLALAVAAGAQELHIYNWNDYFAEDTLKEFEARTGIEVVLDVYDANEVLEAKLFAGHSGYDLVFPTMQPFAARQIQAGLYLPLDRSKLSGWSNLDPQLLQSLAAADPHNAHVVPYMWGTTGLGLNVEKVRAALGADASLDTWGLVFDPANAERLADCGISLLDDPNEVLAAALAYLGRNPNSVEDADLDAAQALIERIYPHVRYINSSQYISDLANGDLCVAHGYSGDVLQAQSRAEEADGPRVIYRIPREGAVLWTDVMGIPKEAPNPDAAHAFISYLLEPEVIADISDHVYYANPNLAATELLDPELRDDPGVYPPEEVRRRLFAPEERSSGELRRLNRLWTRIKAGR